ncbi:uncharacterized protein FA14DRAFT_50160 [Meira miltonrushii]|uniref:Uncharacterized protein n=1 Tax=Meira miltonrushii TaxID=1280837 RepID=A0A316VFX7_9BASI|nr:uncharacterized protein FA14DRAFT_50160 [Meira miltonrushii]PWN35978.1 hypothetical protein FA14DRAFT_50160 [Meira miltonrushii]
MHLLHYPTAIEGKQELAFSGFFRLTYTISSPHLRVNSRDLYIYTCVYIHIHCMMTIFYATRCVYTMKTYVISFP